MRTGDHVDTPYTTRQGQRFKWFCRLAFLSPTGTERKNSARPTRFRPCDLCFRRAGRVTARCDASLDSEISADLLIGLRSHFSIFSECALTNSANHLDFDSAIPRFEAWRPR